MVVHVVFRPASNSTPITRTYYVTYGDPSNENNNIRVGRIAGNVVFGTRTRARGA